MFIVLTSSRMPGTMPQESSVPYGTLFRFEHGYSGEPKRPCVGIVTCSEGWFVYVQDGEASHSGASRVDSSRHHIQIISQLELGALLDKFSQDFENNARNVGGLKAAIEMRRKFDLDQYRAKVKGAFGGDISKLVHAMQFSYMHLPKPDTGVYVVAGTPSDINIADMPKKRWKPGFGYEHLDVVEVVPRLSEYELETLLNDRYPRGFGSIPASVAGTAPWHTVKYVAIEIPTSGAQFLPKDIKRLDQIE